MIRTNSITHADLVDIAERWIRAQHHAQGVYREAMLPTNWIGERPDLYVIIKPGTTAVIEAKVSRSDFNRDKYKPHRATPGLGQFRWFIAPFGLMECYEAQELGWGLLSVTDDGEVTEVERPQVYRVRDMLGELVLAQTLLLRSKKAMSKGAGKVSSKLAKLIQAEAQPGEQPKYVRMRLRDKGISVTLSQVKAAMADFSFTHEAAK